MYTGYGVLEWCMLLRHTPKHLSRYFGMGKTCSQQDVIIITNHIDDISPPDAGCTQKIKFWFGVFLGKWLWEDDNVEY